MLGRVADVEPPTSTSAPPSSAAAASPDLAARVFVPTSGDPLPTGGPRTTAGPVTPETIEWGATLFGRAGCVFCHGARGEGSSTAPRIAGTELPFEVIRRQIRLPQHPRMPAFPPEYVSEEGIVAIYAFLRSLPKD